MPAALAAQLELPGLRFVEQDHRLRRQRAVLGGAEAQHIDARAPGEIGGRTAQPRDRVGEARAVHMHRNPRRMRHLRQPRHLLDGVGGARLGGLGQRQRALLHVVHPGARGEAQRVGQRVGRDAGVGAAQQGELGAAGVELRRAALVLLDMGVAVAIDRRPRRAETRQRQRVGGGAGGDQIDLCGPLEHRRNQRLNPRRAVVIAIGLRRAVVGARHRLEHLGRAGGDIVAGEQHQFIPGMT